MDKIITTFYAQICKLVFNLEKEIKTSKNNPKEANVMSLIALAKKELSGYDAEEWETNTPDKSSLKELYTIFSNYFETDYSRLAFFLIISQNKERIRDYNQGYICGIVDALTKAQINPYNYTFYVDLFLSNPITDQLSLVNLEYAVLYIVSLLKSAPFEEVKHKNYQGILKRLCEVMGLRYSPVFYGNYRLLNVYHVILKAMHEINKMSPQFSNNDFETLKFLIEFYNNLSTPELKRISSKIGELEEESGDDVSKLCRNILRLLNVEKAKQNGIAFVMKPCNKKSADTKHC